MGGGMGGRGYGAGKGRQQEGGGTPLELGHVLPAPTPPGCPGAEVTLCILGSPSTFLSVLLEGGVQSPGEYVPMFLHMLRQKGQPSPGPATSRNTH